MIIDTHTHALVSKEAIPNYEAIKFNLNIAKDIHDINVVCFTEHLDANFYRELMKNVFDKNIFQGQKLSESLIKLNDDFYISSGAEVSLKSGADVGVHTSLDILMSLNTQKGFYTIESLYDDLSKKTSNFIIFAHHLFKPGKWIDRFDQYADCFDAVELPAKDIANKEKYYDFAGINKKSLVAGSDAHTWVQIGVGRTVLDKDHINLGEQFHPSLKSFIAHGKQSIIIEPSATKIVEMSKAYRKTLVN